MENSQLIASAPTPHPLRRFFMMLKLDRQAISYIYLYAIFAGFITLSLPLGIQAIISQIVGGVLSSSLILLIGLVTVGTFLTGLLTIMQLTVTETIQRRIFSRSAFEFAWRIPRIRLDRMIQDYPPELINRFFDTLTLQKGVPKILMDFSTALLQIIFGLILIAFYHPFFVFFGIFLLLVLVIIIRYTGPVGLKTSLQESKFKYKIAHWLQELARTMTTFKLSGSNNFYLHKTDHLVSGYLDARQDHFRILLGQYWSILAFKVLVTASLLFLGSSLVIQNEINIGQFVAAEIVILLILASVEKLILSMDNIYDVLTALEKIGSVTDLALDGEDGLKYSEIDTQQGMQVSLSRVRFQFPDAQRPTLDGIDLDVKPGERICIAGYNGSGKSTLIQIVSGLMLNYEGVVTYNQIPEHNLHYGSLRKMIGDYSSEEDIFKGTLFQNISLGHDSVTFDDVTSAVSAVGLQDYVKHLPKGYDTELVPGGRNVPQSVRTKIILARGIVVKPRLLAMEQFMPHLEAVDQDRIARLLTSRDQPWTLIAVSNNQKLASLCDRVLIMRSGKIIADADFETIKKSEHFAQVFN